jgi:hypothetical protein
LGIRACLAGHRVIFKTATEWVAFLADAQRQDKLDAELDRLDRVPLLVCDEVGYIPFDPQAASLMFMLVSRRYERRSLIVTSNKPFSAWGEIFGDDMAATAMVDRLIHPSRRDPLPQRRPRPPQRPRPRTPPRPPDHRNRLTHRPEAVKAPIAAQASPLGAQPSRRRAPRHEPRGVNS